MTSAEFDAFGPWIVPVDTPDLVPPLYRDHPLDLERALLVLKVPRNISRRDANPSMDLYDHLLVVEPDVLTVLSRSGAGYDVRTLQHAQLGAIDYGADLLDGWLTLFTTDGGAGRGPALTLRFNAVSEDVVEDLVRRLRALALGTVGSGEPSSGERSSGGPRTHMSLGLLDLGESDVGLVTAEHALVRAEPDVAVLGFHVRRTVVPRDTGFTARAMNLVRPVTLHAAIVCASEQELIVLRRRQWLTRSRRPENSVGRTVLLLPRCGRATVRDDARFGGTRVVSVPVGAVAVELLVPTGSSSERALLEQLRVPPG